MPLQATLPRPPEVVIPPEARQQQAAQRQTPFAQSVLPERITRAASKQAYYTVRFLVDRDRKREAYRAYAYFRWVDDCLDEHTAEQNERLAFAERQRQLVDGGYRGDWPDDMTAQEHLLAAIIQGDEQQHSGLQSYIRNMMAVMVFDAQRRGRLISGSELTQYGQQLATAVTDAMHYFIGHEHTPPQSDSCYLPAMGAHITHMLRDTYEDNALGYFNVPCELLESHGITPQAIESTPYREWVKRRVRQARAYFKAGADYLDQVRSLRCRLAGYAYMARFIGILDAIEREDYRLRPAYPEFKRVGYGLRVGGWVCANALSRGKR